MQSGALCGKGICGLRSKGGCDIRYWLVTGSTIARLKSLEDEGALVVNSAYGIDNCVRRPMTELLIQHGVPHPRSFVISTDRQFEEDCYPCWIKRGDSHAMVKEDVCYATDKEEVERVFGRFP